jgi:hypothetical protein
MGPKNVECCFDVAGVEVCIVCVETIVEVANDEAKFSQRISLYSRQRILELLHLKLLHQLRSHLVTRLKLVLSVAKMAANKVKQSILQLERIGHTALISNHSHEAFFNVCLDNL